MKSLASLMLLLAQVAEAGEPYAKSAVWALKLDKVKPYKFKGVAGECFVFIISASEGSHIKLEEREVWGGPDRRQRIKVEFAPSVFITEPTQMVTRDAFFDPAEANDRNRLCLIKDGPVTLTFDKTTSIGRGTGQVELWKRVMSPDELKALREGRQMIADRDAASDRHNDEMATIYTCANCKQNLRSCQEGTTQPSLSSTCAKDFYNCADHAKFIHHKPCH